MTQTRKKKTTWNLSMAAVFLALGIVLPFFTGQIPQIGNMLLPMHLPVLLCGLICGWQYGGTVGFILPLLRYALFGMPYIFPTGISMAFELAAYGMISGAVYFHTRRQSVGTVYRALLIAMLGGRVVWAVVRMLLMGMAGVDFGLQIFVMEAFVNAVPGIVLQLVLIPILMAALDRTGMLRFSRSQPAEN